MGRFTEITSSVTKQYRDAGQWGNYSSLVESSTLCALRFHNPDQPFYLYYKGYTKNVGWDTPVKSTDYSYAGSFSGKLQAVGISLYNSSTGQLWDNTYVMMYRAYCENYWLPWVSNATPNLMRQVQDEFNLGGVLDYSSTNAGLPGGDGAMTKFEIRIFKDNGSDAPSGGGAASGISQRYMVNGSWNTLTSGTSVSAFHGVELKTSGKPYYLYYRTYNTGHGWYPFVRSTEADYAGSSGKAIEGLQIQVYDNSGQRINQRHVVMYRAYAGGRWLSWVSNAPLSIMQMLQNRYSLEGSLDSRSYYAGLLDKGAPITKLDIRVYEYVSNSDASGVGGLDSITQIYHANGEWHTLTPDTYVSQMDHVKFSTYGKDYYLYYQVYSAGYGWYPRVSSDGTDDAGSTGKAIEGLAIDVYSKSGEKLRDRVAVMYRAYANGRWLPWVSNADPGIMQQIHQNYHLGGTLDTAGAYAGIKGVTINRLEVRVYTGVGSLSPLPGANVTMSCAHLSGSWQNFSESYMGTVSGIKIQTPGKPYYLQYRTWNEGRTDYYPWVTSNINDYAGSLGKPVQRLQIQAYKNNGAKLTSGIVVMYRTYTNGRWLPWVSNADPSSMRYVQSKYALPGALETTASYAGIPGANIGGVEIRVYEESLPSGDGQPDIPDFPDIPANGRGMKIYIDAGHGGTSPGTAWGNNIEKNYNLQISLLQEKYFKQKGFQVKMARTTDIFSTLAERSGEANAWGAHLYLSNHINAGGGKGVTTFYQYKSAESKKYATAIEQQLKKVVGTSMGVRTRIEDGEDYYHVLRETRMTSVLIEHCFLDNAEDRALLNAPGALDAMAKATVNAVCSCIPDYVEPGESDKPGLIDQGTAVLKASGIISSFNLPCTLDGGEFHLEYGKEKKLYFSTPICDYTVTYGAALSTKLDTSVEIPLYKFKVINGKLEEVNVAITDKLSGVIKQTGSNPLGQPVFELSHSEVSKIVDNLTSVSAQIGNGSIEVHHQILSLTTFEVKFVVRLKHKLNDKTESTLKISIKYVFTVKDRKWEFVKVPQEGLQFLLIALGITVAVVAIGAIIVTVPQLTIPTGSVLASQIYPYAAMAMAWFTLRNPALVPIV